MPWQVLTGVVEWWADEGLRDIGRLRYHEARGDHDDDSDLIPVGSVHTTRMAFVAKHFPWRLTGVFLNQPDDENPEAIYSWADDIEVAILGNPAEHHLCGRNETLGDLGLRRMLETGSLETLVPKPWAANFRVAGHLVERDMFLLPEFISLATDDYEVTYNDDLGILTSWDSIIDGSLACRLSLASLHLVE